MIMKRAFIILKQKEMINSEPALSADRFHMTPYKNINLVI